MSLRLSSNYMSDSITIQDTKFELSPQYNDSGLLSSFILSGSEKHPNLVYKWSRIRNEKTFQIKDQTSNSYITTCDDIEAFIQVDFSSSPDSFSGSCKIGPLRLERSVRKSLEYIMNKGFATFPLSCTGDLDYNNASDLVLDVSQEMLKLTTYARDGSKDETNSFESSFSVTYPRITLHPSDCQQLCFEMNDGKSDGDLKFSRKLLVSCLNQQTRDLILMSIRVFGLKNSVKVDRALEFYLNDLAKCKTDLSIEHSLVLQELYELFDENQSLKKQLLEQSSLQKAHTSQISSLKSKISELEINLHTRNSSEESPDTERLKGKVEKLSEEKGALKEKHKTMQKELNELKMKIDQKDLQNPQESSKNNEILSQELEILRARNKTLTEKAKRQKSALVSFENENKDIK